jgi:hypothetical protein
VTWRGGTKVALAARFATLSVRVADGTVWANNRHLPGAEVWVNGAHRASANTISAICRAVCQCALAAAIKARWVCEQAHQQLKEELERWCTRQVQGGRLVLLFWF